MLIMATSIIIGTDYATRVRNRLGVTDTDLTTTEIDEMLEVTEYEVADRITNYASLTGKDLAYLKSGTVAALAAAMCPVLKAKIPKRQKELNTDIESGENWTTKESKLLSEKEKWLSKITGYTSDYSAMPLFTLAGPIRSGNGLFE